MKNSRVDHTKDGLVAENLKVHLEIEKLQKQLA
jgi:hypothetical protein